MAKQVGKPEEPSKEDCCGNGCSPCVFDIYETRLLSYQQTLSCQQKCEQDYRTDLLSETRFKQFLLIEKLFLCENVYKLRFQAKQNTTENSSLNGVLPYSLGQYLVLKFYTQDSENLNSSDCERYSKGKVESERISLDQNKMITRAYTPVTVAEQENNCCFDIIVKLYPGGLASSCLRESQINDIFYWRGPCGSFCYKVNSFQHILMICIGTGIAPFIPLLKAILENELEDTVVHLLYGVKNIHQVIMRDWLRSMCQYWNFTLQYFFSQNVKTNNDLKFGECFKLGTIGKDQIKEYLDGKDLDQVLVLVCGTDKFSNEIKTDTLELGVNCNNNIYIF